MALTTVERPGTRQPNLHDLSGQLGLISTDAYIFRANAGKFYARK